MTTDENRTAEPSIIATTREEIDNLLIQFSGTTATRVIADEIVNRILWHPLTELETVTFDRDKTNRINDRLAAEVARLRAQLDAGDDVVEQAARVLAGADEAWLRRIGAENYSTWDDLPERSRDQYRSDARALAAAGLLRSPAPKPGGEPLWQVSVTVPMRLDAEQRHELFSAVVSTVEGWEPNVRDGWDADVSGHPADESGRGSVPEPGPDAQAHIEPGFTAGLLADDLEEVSINEYHKTWHSTALSLFERGWRKPDSGSVPATPPGDVFAQLGDVIKCQRCGMQSRSISRGYSNCGLGVPASSDTTETEER